MIKDNLQPKNIADIIHRMDEYLTEMRANRQGSMEFMNDLEKFIRDYFKQSTFNELDLKKDAVAIVDGMYIQINRFMMRDIHTEGYFGIIANLLFFELARKNILVFFILDNSLRDDRFKLTVELFGVSHFTTIFPYSTEELVHSNDFTQLPIKEYKAVEKQIDDAVAEKKHIFYLEKDGSVNYLHNVLALAEEFQNKYVCVFRNQAPDSDKKATWLLGSFSDLIK